MRLPTLSLDANRVNKPGARRQKRLSPTDGRNRPQCGCGRLVSPFPSSSISPLSDSPSHSHLPTFPLSPKGKVTNQVSLTFHPNSFTLSKCCFFFKRRIRSRQRVNIISRLLLFFQIIRFPSLSPTRCLPTWTSRSTISSVTVARLLAVAVETVALLPSLPRSEVSRSPPGPPRPLRRRFTLPRFQLHPARSS
jgi:hypothetical protein